MASLRVWPVGSLPSVSTVNEIANGILIDHAAFAIPTDRSGVGVFDQTMELGGARDRNDPRLLREQPGERNLGGCDLFPSGDFSNEIHERLVRLPRLGREPRHNVPEIGSV